MKIKHTLITAVFIIASVTSYAQKVGSMYLPAMGSDCPDWFKVFYNSDFPKGINVHLLDEQAREYKHLLKRNAAVEEDKPILTGEENEDIYLLYYVRWRRSYDRSLTDTAPLNPFSEKDPAAHEPDGIYSGMRTASHMPVAQWSVIGPLQTFFKYDDDNAQPACSWQENIYSFAVSKSNNSILYASPETGGMFKTVDKGLHWVSLMDNMNAGTFYAVAIHPANPDIVYAGGNGQMYKTVDGGVTWTVLAVPTSYINRIVIRATDANVVFAACDNGLFRSSDAGATWAITGGMNTVTYDVALNVTYDTVVYALRKLGMMTNFYMSLDGGVTFAISSTSWSSTGLTACSAGRMTVTAADANRIYCVLLGVAPAPAKPYIFRSNDGGVTWDTTCTGIIGGLGGSTAAPLGMSNGQGFYDLDIIANPLNADEVIVGTTTCYRSVDGGNLFDALGGYHGNFPLHPDVQCMMTSGNDTWLAMDGGMNYSNDFFADITHFSSRNKGIYGSDDWGFAQGWNEDLVAGGRYHNGNTVLRETYPAGDALRLGGGEAPTGYYMPGKNGNIVFSDIGPGVIVPPSFGASNGNFAFNMVPNEDGYGWDASNIQFYPYCYNIVFLGNGNELWKSTDGGNSWVSLHNFTQGVRKFEISRSNPNVIYLATTTTLYKTIDGGTTWSILTLPPGLNISELKISVDFEDENKVWFSSTTSTSSNRVWNTTTGGSSWNNMTTPTIAAQRYIYSVHQQGTDGGIYIIGPGGKVFYKNNLLTDWVDYSLGLPKGFYPLKIEPFYRDSKLRAAGNRGYWEIPLYEESLPIAMPTVDKLTSTCLRDTFYFDDYSVLKHASATWHWTITPAPAYIDSDTIRNPKVLFTALGLYSVSLTVTNLMGTSTKAITNMINITGNVCAVDTIPGKVLTLTDVGDYATQSKPMGITTNNFTISVWVKPDTIENSYAGIVFTGSSGACGLNFKDNNQIGYHWNGTSSSWGWAGGPTVPTHEWSHLCLVVTPTNNTIYLNGVAYPHTNTHAPATFNQIFQIGKDRGYTSRNYRGQLDEVAMYNRALSQNEVRNLMNLTKNNPNPGSMPTNDASLVAYYQFNEGAGLPAYDKVGVNHIVLDGAATKTSPSTAPVGGGVFQTVNIVGSGTFNFSTPGVAISNPATGTYPNGDVIVTRLNVPSDQPASYIPLPDNPISYYVIRNYGSNATFSPLSSMQFTHVQGTTSTMVSNPNRVKLYTRSANADSITWLSPIDSASLVTNLSGTGTITFGSGLDVTQYGQFALGYTDPSHASITPLTTSGPTVTVYPNPAKEGIITVALDNLGNNKKGSLRVINNLSQTIKNVSLTEMHNKVIYHIYIPTAGIYYLVLSFDEGGVITRKVVVE